MKKIALLSHCIWNPFCEAEEPAAKTLYRQIVAALMEKDVAILQLPCPELTYQGLIRDSLYPDSEKAEEYTKFCRGLLKVALNNIKEYQKNGVAVVALLGIDTSPSCSAIDPTAFMTNELLKMMADEEIPVKCMDMPISVVVKPQELIDEILSLF